MKFYPPGARIEGRFEVSFLHAQRAQTKIGLRYHHVRRAHPRGHLHRLGEQAPGQFLLSHFRAQQPERQEQSCISGIAIEALCQIFEATGEISLLEGAQGPNAGRLGLFFPTLWSR